MGGVDEAAVGLGAAVVFLHGVPEHTVVAPVVGAVEAVDGQQLDVRDAEADEVGQLRDRGVERALGSEGADVQFVDEAARERPARPVLVGPGEGCRVVPRRQLVHPVRLAPRPRVGPCRRGPRVGRTGPRACRGAVHTGPRACRGAAATGRRACRGAAAQHEAVLIPRRERDVGAPPPGIPRRQLDVVMPRPPQPHAIGSRSPHLDAHAPILPPHRNNSGTTVAELPQTPVSSRGRRGTPELLRARAHARTSSATG